jgi:hypothetical protein
MKEELADHFEPINIFFEENINLTKIKNDLIFRQIVKLKILIIGLQVRVINKMQLIIINGFYM